MSETTYPTPPAPTREEAIVAMARAMFDNPAADRFLDDYKGTYAHKGAIRTATAAYDALLAMGAIRTGKE